MRAGRVGHGVAPDLSTRTLCELWLMATMATIHGHPGADLLTKNLCRHSSWLVITLHTSLQPFVFLSKLQLGVAMVAREPSQTRGHASRSD